MSKLEINLTLDDMDSDKSPEVFISFVEYKERIATITHTSVVTSSKKDGVYDKVLVKADVDGDGKGTKKGSYDRNDNQALTQLAQAFVKFAKVAGGA